MGLFLTPTTSHSPIILVLISLGWVVSSSGVDFSQIPDCARGDCFPYHSSSIGCPQLTIDCFCNALAPINCASQNCTGYDWYAVEDWFATQCPNPPNVTFSGLPECSRACFRSALIPTYCEAQITRNCFCRLETEFESLAPCLETPACNETVEDANNTLVTYYRESCIYDPSADGTGSQDESSTDQGGDQVIDSPGDSSGGTRTFDKVQNVVGLASGLVALVAALIGFLVWVHRRVSQLARVSEDFINLCNRRAVLFPVENFWTRHHHTRKARRVGRQKTNIMSSCNKYI